MEIYLMRHGQTAANRAGIIQGDSDGPLAQLNEKGQAQAASMAKVVSELNPQTIYCSPLQRTRDTLALVMGTRHAPVTFDTRLREINYGSFQGKTIEWATMMYPEWWNPLSNNVLPGYETVSGGESYTTVTQRTMAFLRSIPEQSGPVLVVTHGFVVRSALAGILGIPETPNLIEPPNVSLTCISRRCGNFSVWYYGR
ncbi:histidine phosphatase family protein [Schleiferilactobacillus perolens]|uniref:Phosphoglycerate mutase n=1 Tax=Schleiferilactobacillus perolens DSM 12744 TaxID=1423792 RepID=A0A0R1MXE0_9LACO|nr:histidine phosphatase family protein [Schleiferilactobacillus perolens]KRL12815.1 hypothetical protein FD09_GL002802 [Schleiferilactobacillus perolens DSM 12744]